MPLSGKHLNSAYQSTNCKILINQYAKIHVSGIFSCNLTTIQYSTSSKSDSSAKSTLPNKDCYQQPLEKKSSIFQRMKQMTKDYWHILIPVHIVTSLGWASVFYIAAKKYVRHAA